MTPLGCHPIGTRVARNSDGLEGMIVEIFPQLVQDEWGSYRASYGVKLDFELSASGVRLTGTTPRLHGGQFTVAR
jgi:hypothetical protein